MRAPIPKSLAQAGLLLIILIGSLALSSFGLQSFLSISSEGSIYYPAEAMVLFEDEFENGDFSAWSGTYTTVDDNAIVASAYPYEGTYHSCFQTGAIVSGVKYAYSHLELSQAVSEVYARGYFYIVDGLPLNDNEDRFGLIAFEVGGQLQCTFRVHRSGGVDKFNIVGLSGTGSVQKSTDAVYPVERQWYCLEFYIKVHSSSGEYRAWINGVEQIAITNIDTTRYGSSVSRVRFGLTYTSNVQHSVEVYCDSVIMSTRYIGQFRPLGVIGSVDEIPAIRNFYWLFGNQNIRYEALTPSEVKNLADIEAFDGLVVWTKRGGYNATAVEQFAQKHVVIAHLGDFCNVLYPSLKGSAQVVTTNTVTYVKDWGNFRNGDLAEMRNETGNIDKLTTLLASGLAGFTDVTQIARYDANRIALFHINGTQARSGFYVMDLDATTPETEWTGIWHLFPAIKMIQDFPTGKYARWMASGQNWWSLTQVYNHIDTIVNENGDVAKKWVIGQSVEGRDILAIVIGNGPQYAIIDGSMHGNEKTGTFACLRIAELLVEYYRSDPFWRSRLTEYTVIIIPALNPDGFALNTRGNANGVDLNRQFPPDGTTTEPEAWALRNLMDNYTPTIYINVHEGWHNYPLHMLYGNYESSATSSITIAAMRQANDTFVQLRQWGWFTENDANVWIGKVNSIIRGGINSMAVAYASYEYQASCMLLETFLWSGKWDARKCLWGTDYYPAVIISFLQRIQR